MKLVGVDSGFFVVCIVNLFGAPSVLEWYPRKKSNTDDLNHAGRWATSPTLADEEN